MFQQLGQKIIVGFEGTTPNEPGVQQVQSWAREGLIGGVIFFRHNLIERQQIINLVESFRDLPLLKPLLLAIDQEGGLVQRLNEKNGFHTYPSAKEIADTCTPAQAFDIYNQLATDVHEAGFNLVFGPVVDLHSETSKAIGRWKRSFSSDPSTVVSYAEQFINAFKGKKILTCLKHWLGHGLAQDDTHDGMVDVTHTHQPAEFVPFQTLAGTADLIMTAHIMHRDYDANYPATLSKALLRPLLEREDITFISDDLEMDAIKQNFSLKETVVRATGAGVDLLLFSMKKPKNINDDSCFVQEKTPLQIIEFIQAALETKELESQEIQRSLARIAALKERLQP